MHLVIVTHDTLSAPMRAGRMLFNRVLAKIWSCERMLSAPTAAAAKPPTGRLLVDPYRACARRFLSGKEPGGSGNQRIGTGFAASLSGGTATYNIMSILYFFSQQSICII